MSAAFRCVCAVAAVVAALSEARAVRLPQTFDWHVASPESQSVSGKALEDLKDRLAAVNTKAFLVIRNDRVVHEWYAPDHSGTAKHYTASMAKAIVGGVSIAVALTDRRLALDHPVSDHVPQWKSDPRKARITIRQLGSHTSGLEDAEADNLPHDKLTGWKGDFWKRLDPPNDAFSIPRDKAPVRSEPGEKFQYSNPGIAMLTYALTSALRDSATRDARTLLRDRVMRPIGVSDADWTIGYGATYTVDGLPLVAAWGGGNYTARAVARVGRLMLRQGDWDGTPILSNDAVRQVTTDAGTPGHGGIGWWSNAEGKYPQLPRDAFWGSGAGHQVLLVIPSLNLIAVRNGGSLGATIEHHDLLNAVIFAPLVAAIGAAKAPDPDPVAPSPVIRELVWAPAATIRRAARGSESSSFPTKWMSGDGTTVHLVFSGDDAFSVRRATVVLR